MAHLQARAGIARAGVTYAGLSSPTVKVTIAGVDRTANVVYQDFKISQILDGQATATLKVKDFTPAVGNEIKIAYRTPNEYLFTGTIMRRRYRSNGLLVWWDLDCGDYQWLLDRYALVTGTFRSCGINTAIARILASFTDPASGFRVGIVPSSLGDLDATGITFTQERVSSAIGRLCDIAGAHWYINHEKQVCAFVDADVDGNALTLGNASDIQDLTYLEDLYQLRTSAIVAGERAPVHTAAAAGAMTILVPSANAFDPAGGTVMIGTQVVAYSGVVTTTDPVTGEAIAQLQLSGALAADIPSGTDVVVLEQADDAAAQASLAAALGGGQSGVSVGYSEDESAGTDAAAGIAAGEVEQYSGASPLMELEYATKDPFTRVGKSVAVTISSPTTIGGDFLIQKVDYEIWGVVAGIEANLKRYVVASQGRHTLDETLAAVLRRTGAAS